MDGHKRKKIYLPTECEQNTKRVPTEYQRGPAAAEPRPARSAARQAGRAGAPPTGPVGTPLLLVLSWYSVGILLLFCWYSVSIRLAFG